MGFELIDNLPNCTVSISYTQYIDTILNCFWMNDATSHSVPIEGNVILLKHDILDPPLNLKKFPYQKLVSALIWISLIS